MRNLNLPNSPKYALSTDIKTNLDESPKATLVVIPNGTTFLLYLTVPPEIQEHLDKLRAWYDQSRKSHKELGIPDIPYCTPPPTKPEEKSLGQIYYETENALNRIHHPRISFCEWDDLHEKEQLAIEKGSQAVADHAVKKEQIQLNAHIKMFNEEITRLKAEIDDKSTQLVTAWASIEANALLSETKHVELVELKKLLERASQSLHARVVWNDYLMNDIDYALQHQAKDGAK